MDRLHCRQFQAALDEETAGLFAVREMWKKSAFGR
jgi:hypothetical protein